MYFSKFKKKDKRGQVNFLDGCVFWLHWHQLLINGNTYFHIQKSYFCSFSFHPVFLILLFVYLKGRPSCSFSTNGRSGLPCQLTIPGGLWACLGCGSWGPDAQKTFLCCSNGGDSYMLLCFSYHISKPTKQVISTLVRSGGLSPHLPGPGLLAWKFVNINE